MAVDDAAALLMGMGQAAPLGGAGGLLGAPPVAAVAHPALFTDVARQLEDAATVLQAATSDNGLAEFDALAALSLSPQLSKRCSAAMYFLRWCRAF